MNIYKFYIRLSRLVSVCNNVNKKREDGRFLFINLQTETKRQSRIKKIIYFHYQCSLGIQIRKLKIDLNMEALSIDCRNKH